MNELHSEAQPLAVRLEFFRETSVIVDDEESRTVLHNLPVRIVLHLQADGSYHPLGRQHLTRAEHRRYSHASSLSRLTVPSAMNACTAARALPQCQRASPVSMARTLPSRSTSRLAGSAVTCAALAMVLLTSIRTGRLPAPWAARN